MEEVFMRRAIELAKMGAGKTNPNPMVGAVVVKDGRIIGEGYHQKFGGLHAERNALASCTESPEGAALYVTLEPCCHYGKTPPCTEAIIEKGISRVVIGSRDPNPLVAGKGAAILKAAGIRVEEDFLREECDAVNPVFFRYIRNKQPFVALKYAMTADGKIAANSGKSQWITGEAAREHVHVLRNYYMGILVGIGTVLADDPMLTCRIAGGRNPVRIVCDSHLRIPPESKLCSSANEVPLIIACTGADPKKRAVLEEKGAVILEVPEKEGEVDITCLLEKLGEMGIDGILVEGGGGMNASFVRENAVQRVYVYIGAQIFGGVNRFTPVGGAGIEEVADSMKLSDPQIMTFGDDVLIQYDCKGD